MKTIKFRAWDKQINKWYKPTNEAYKGNLFEVLIGFSGDLVAHTMTGLVHESMWPDRFELMQFTGLKDKNGVEIYEFDIVAIDNEENPVITKCIYEPGYFTLLDSAGGSWTRQLFHQQERLEVVGNRFENPELL